MFKKVGMGIVSAATVLIVGVGLSNTASADLKTEDLYEYQEWEPNNTLETADDFGLNGVVFGNFDTEGDKVDVYKFKAKTTNLAYFSLGIKNWTKNDYNLYLLDEKGIVLAKSEAEKTSSLEDFIYKVKKDQTYYIKVVAKERGSQTTTKYTLKAFSEGNYTIPEWLE
ncbi:TPA: hypothetical protein QCQ09_004635 [Bacillus cereus]|nr:hypothetical protein [Bacillus cereus]